MKKIAMLITLMLVAVTLASCGALMQGPAEDVSAESASGEALPPPVSPSGFEIVIAGDIDSANGTVDPVCEDGSITRIMPLTFEGLVKTAGDGIEPCLADSWEISGDGLTYTFKLKPGVKFSDGTPVTTGDWLWSFERARFTEKSPRVSYAAPIESVTASGEDTIIIKLKAPYAPFLSALALDNFAVQSKEHAEKTGADRYSLEPVGTGPFYFEDWSAHEYYRMKINPYYHRKIATNAGALLFKVVRDEDARVSKLLAGEADVCTDLSTNRVAQLEDGDNINMGIYPSASQLYINLNVTKTPLSSPDVRRALRMATDKKEIIDMVLFGLGKPAYNVFSRSSLYFNADIADAGFDIDGAKKLLADAGYKNGFETEISCAADNSVTKGVATMLKEQWAKIGVNVTLNSFSKDELATRHKNLGHAVTIMRWTDETNDPASLAGFIGAYDDTKGFYTGYNNPGLTALINEAAITSDTEERKAAYREIQQILYDDAPMIPVWQADYLIAAHANITGFKQAPQGQYILDDLKKE